MVTRDEYLAKTKGYNRPAINFNQRDDIRDFGSSKSEESKLTGFKTVKKTVEQIR